MKKRIYVGGQSYRLADSGDEPISICNLNEIVSKVNSDYPDHHLPDPNKIIEVGVCVSEWSGKIDLVVSVYREETDEEYERRKMDQAENIRQKIDKIRDLLDGFDLETTTSVQELVNNRLMEFSYGS